MRRLSLAVLALLVTVIPATTSAQTPDRGWIDVNVISLAPAQDGQTYTYRSQLFGETATFVTDYPAMPRRTGVLFGGGFGVGAGLGIAVQWTSVPTEYTVGMGISIPHPTVFNRFATDADVTGSTLERKDNSFDFSVVYQLPTPDAWRVRVFGGPTLFTVSQDFVETIRYTQVYNLLGANIVDITGYTERTVDDTAWGVHGGVDVAYFFSRHVGVGGTIRANRGTVTVDSEPFSGATADLKAGGVILGGGLRLRF